MKIIIIGLGNFGGHFGISLMAEGHEVYGADLKLSRAEKYAHLFTASVALDTSSELGITELPFEDTDTVVIAIGEDVGAAITTASLVKKHFSGRIIARSINDVHKGILEAMNISDIIEPEREFAADLAHRIGLAGAIKSMELQDDFEIVEVAAPRNLIGKNIKDLDAKKLYTVYIITIIKKIEKKLKLINSSKYDMKTLGILPPDYIIEENDYLLIFGRTKLITKFINHFS